MTDLLVLEKGKKAEVTSSAKKKARRVPKWRKFRTMCKRSLNCISKRRKVAKKAKQSEKNGPLDNSEKSTKVISQSRYHRPYKLSFMMNDQTLKGIITTGSSASFINRRFLPPETVVKASKCKFRGIDGKRVKILGTVEQDIAFGSRDNSTRMKLYVVPDKPNTSDALLGQDFLHNPKFTPDLIKTNKSIAFIMSLFTQRMPGLKWYDSVSTNIIAWYTAVVSAAIVLIATYLQKCVPEDSLFFCYSYKYLQAFSVPSEYMNLFLFLYFGMMIYFGFLMDWAARKMHPKWMLPWLITFSMAIAAQIYYIVWVDYGRSFGYTKFTDTGLMFIGQVTLCCFNCYCFNTVFEKCTMLWNLKSPNIPLWLPS